MIRRLTFFRAVFDPGPCQKRLDLHNRPVRYNHQVNRRWKVVPGTTGTIGQLPEKSSVLKTISDGSECSCG
jgi:hypothetical protein